MLRLLTDEDFNGHIDAIGAVAMVALASDRPDWTNRVEWLPC